MSQQSDDLTRKRIVFHVDLDYFYAQCEQVRKPELRDKPVAVCIYSGRTEDSGAVSTANYAARALGVKSGLPIIVAKRIAAGRVEFIKADLDYYESVSMRIMAILRSCSSIFEQASVDEAYIEMHDISYGKAVAIAEDIKKKILEAERLTCSVGIGSNKLMAKMAAGFRKPDGLTLVREEENEKFLEDMQVGDIFGVGKVTEAKLNEMGIHTVSELRSMDLYTLQSKFGSSMGIWLYNASRGIDDEAVKERQREQYGKIVTLKSDTRDANTILSAANEMADEVATMVRADNQMFKTVSFIGILEDLSIRSKNKTLQEFADSGEAISGVMGELVERFLSEHEGKLRRIGIKVSNLSERKMQKKLWDF
ncbi:MAG: DNA polymerase IV [Methanomassiliicoccales archaeon]